MHSRLILNDLTQASLPSKGAKVEKQHQVQAQLLLDLEPLFTDSNSLQWKTPTHNLTKDENLPLVS